jgi:tetratricopeptide (TPR) repeat protein
MWVAMIVLIVGVGGGGLYIFTRDTGTNGTPVTATLNADPTVVEKGKPITLTWNSKGATELDLEPGVGKVDPQGSKTVTPQDSTTYTLSASVAGGTPRNVFARVTVTAPDVPVVPPVKPPVTDEPPVIPDRPPKHPDKPKPHQDIVRTVDHAKVQAKIAEGNFYFHRGEYNEAIRLYEEGLAMDPSNSSLRDTIQRTKHARETEQKVGVQ